MLNFVDLRKGEVRRKLLPGTWVNERRLQSTFRTMLRNRLSPTLRYCLCMYERAECDLALEDAMLELFRGGALAAATSVHPPDPLIGDRGERVCTASS